MCVMSTVRVLYGMSKHKTGKTGSRIDTPDRELSSDQADHTSQFDRDSPALERDVPVYRKSTFGTHLCSGLQKAVLVGTDGITCYIPVVSAS